MRSVFHSNKKKKRAIAAVCFTVIFLALIFTLYGEYQSKKHEKQDREKRILLESTGKPEKNTNTVRKDWKKLYDTGSLQDDIRLQYFNYIQLSSKMQQGDYVDLRILFPDGTDYIILSKKKILDIERESDAKGQTEQGLVWFMVSEEEILRLSSAVVEAASENGSVIYALQYAGKDQKPAIMNYPVKKNIRSLIKENPNVVKRAANILESSLHKAKNQVQKNKNTDDNSHELSEDKNINYMD